MSFKIRNDKNKIIDLLITAQDGEIYGVRTKFENEYVDIKFGAFYNFEFIGKEETNSKFRISEVSSECVRDIKNVSEIHSKIKSGFGLFCLDSGIGFGVLAYPALLAYEEEINNAIKGLESDKPTKYVHQSEFDDEVKEIEDESFINVNIKQHIGFNRNGEL